jgi:transposase
MSSKYEPEFKHKIVKLHFEEGRSSRSIATEYEISKASITNWCNEFKNRRLTFYRNAVSYH